MKLYRSKIPVIAHDTIELLVKDGDIEVTPDNRAEAENDLVAIMEEFMRRDNEFRNRIRDHMAHRGIPYDQFGETRKKMSEEFNHPLSEDIERFLARQFIENMLISRFIDEVFGDDRAMYKKVLDTLRAHDVDERAIRDEAIGRIKNVKEGTVDYEIALENAVKEVKKRKGLL